jgi:tetratricopeptide (TPR) repeat protein
MKSIIRAGSGFALICLILLNAGMLHSCKVSRTSAGKKPVKADTTEVVKNNPRQNEFEYLFIEGIKQRTLGNPDEAIKIFSRCLEIDPNSSAALYEMANIHVSRGDFQSSMVMCEKAVSLNPENPFYHLLLVKIYVQNKLYDKAAGQYEALVKLAPENQDYKFQQAAVLSMAGKPDQALAIYNKLEASLGFIEPIAIGKQQLFLQLNNKKAAYAEIEKLIKQYPGEPKYYGLLADMYLADKNREKALENYNKILQIDPDEGFAHLSLANFYLEGKQFDKAYEQIIQAFKNPDLELESKAQLFLGLTQPGEGKPNEPQPQFKLNDEQQLELMNILIKAHPGDERPRSLMVDYYLGKKQMPEARKQLLQVLDMKKDNYLYWERLLFIDNDLQNWKLLSEDSKKAISWFPEQPVPYMMNSIALLQLKQYDSLLAAVDSGEVHSKDNPKILSQLNTYRAEAYYNKKDFNRAFNAYEKSIEQDPQNYMAMNNYAYYLSLKGVKLDTAEKLSGTVIQANPDNATYLDTYAWVLFKKKDFKLAKFYMESALSKVTDDSAVLVEHYGDILYFLNDKQNALEQWKKSLSMGNQSPVLREKIAKKIYIDAGE